MAQPNPQPYSGGTGQWGAMFNAQPSVSSGTGLNTKGSGKKYGGPKGFFQWGFGQHGYVNPAGTINWDVSKVPEQAKLISYGKVSPYARSSGQLAKRTDKFGMPMAPAIEPPKFLDPSYFAKMAEYESQRNIQQLEYQQQLQQMERQRKVASKNLQEGYMDERDVMNAQMAQAGGHRSGMADSAIDRMKREHTLAREQMREEFGVPAQQRVRAARELLESNLNLIRQTQQGLAKERAKAENLARKSAGLKPKSMTPEKMGFFKRGSSWFYRNPQGVVVSVAGDPAKMQNALGSALNRVNRSSN